MFSSVSAIPLIRNKTDGDWVILPSSYSEMKHNYSDLNVQFIGGEGGGQTDEKFRMVLFPCTCACADDHECYHNFINIISDQQLWVQKFSASPPHCNPRNNVHKNDNFIYWHRKFYSKRNPKSYQNIILQTVTNLMEMLPLLN
jgi:hypothetical protein